MQRISYEKALLELATHGLLSWSRNFVHDEPLAGRKSELRR